MNTNIVMHKRTPVKYPNQVFSYTENCDRDLIDRMNRYNNSGKSYKSNNNKSSYLDNAFNTDLPSNVYNTGSFGYLAYWDDNDMCISPHY